jgi:prephenate dehydrogenase
LALAEELAEALGARPLRLDPTTHDARVAAVSHLPQLAASALALTVEEERLRFPDALPRMAAGGYRDATRVAACPPWLGSDMVGANAPEIRRLVRRFRIHLESLLEESAEVRDERFRAASEARARLLDRPESGGAERDRGESSRVSEESSREPSGTSESSEGGAEPSRAERNEPRRDETG